MFHQVFVIIFNYFRSYGSKRSETEMLLFTRGKDDDDDGWVKSNNEAGKK